MKYRFTIYDMTPIKNNELSYTPIREFNNLDSAMKCLVQMEVKDTTKEYQLIVDPDEQVPPEWYEA